MFSYQNASSHFAFSFDPRKRIEHPPHFCSSILYFAPNGTPRSLQLSEFSVTGVESAWPPNLPEDASFQAAPYYKYKEYLLRCVDQLHPGDIKAWKNAWTFWRGCMYNVWGPIEKPQYLVDLHGILVFVMANYGDCVMGFLRFLMILAGTLNKNSGGFDTNGGIHSHHGFRYEKTIQWLGGWLGVPGSSKWPIWGG